MNANTLPRPDPPGRRAAAVLAFTVHALLALLLLYGITWQSKQPEAVEVMLYRSLPHVAAPQPVSLPTPPPAVATPVPPPPQPPAQPVAKADIVQKTPHAAPKQEKQVPPVSPPPTYPESRQDSMAAHLKRESEQLREAKAAQALASEMQRLQAAADRRAEANYIDRVRSKIRGNIVLPPGLQGNPEARFTVTQLPDGSVLDVRLQRSSGNAALDDAIERAIRKSSPLPKPERGTPERMLDLKFQPLADSMQPG